MPGFGSFKDDEGSAPPLPSDDLIKFRFVSLLAKLKLAGVKKLSIPHQLTLIGRNPPKVPKYAIPLAIVSLSQDFLVLVPYKDRDKSLQP